jgi:hypothetical protein
VTVAVVRFTSERCRARVQGPPRTRTATTTTAHDRLIVSGESDGDHHHQVRVHGRDGRIGANRLVPIDEISSIESNGRFTTSGAVQGSNPAAHAHGHGHEEAHDRLIVFGDRDRERARERARARARARRLSRVPSPAKR